MDENKEVKIEVLYEKKLDFEEVRKNPILQPIAQVNSLYKSQSMSILRELYEYENLKKEIDEMIKINPVYSETLIMGKVQLLIGYVKNIIHSQDVKRAFIKDAINEMVDINKKYYQLTGTEKDVEKGEIIKDSETRNNFYSELLEKEISVPVGIIKEKKVGRPKVENEDRALVEQFCGRCNKRISTVMKKNYDKDKLCSECRKIKAKDYGIEMETKNTQKKENLPSEEDKIDKKGDLENVE